MRSHLRGTALKGSAAVILCALGASVATACGSANGPGDGVTASSAEALSILPGPLFRSYPWAYGQSGNSSAQTAASATDTQVFCAGPGGFARPLEDFIVDTASPYNGAWSTLPPSYIGIPYQHVTATPNATAQALKTAGPAALSAFWIDQSGDVRTEDETSGKWGTSIAIGGGYSALGKASGPAVPWAPVASTWVDSGSPAQLAFWVGQDGSVWEAVRTATWAAPMQVAPAGSAAGPIDVTAKVGTRTRTSYGSPPAASSWTPGGTRA